MSLPSPPARPSDRPCSVIRVNAWLDYTTLRFKSYRTSGVRGTGRYGPPLPSDRSRQYLQVVGARQGCQWMMRAGSACWSPDENSLSRHSVLGPSRRLPLHHGQPTQRTGQEPSVSSTTGSRHLSQRSPAPPTSSPSQLRCAGGARPSVLSRRPICMEACMYQAVIAVLLLVTADSRARAGATRAGLRRQLHAAQARRAVMRE